MTKNEIAYQSLIETKRANQAKESELNRSNVASETLRSQELAEQSRHNLVSEAELSKHNRASEQLGLGQLSLGWNQLAEQARSNDLRDAQYYAGLDNAFSIANMQEEGRNIRFYDDLELKEATTFSKPSNLVGLAIGKLINPKTSENRLGRQPTITIPKTRQTNSNSSKTGGSNNGKTKQEVRQQGFGK